eukprot:4284781-Pyramimonas_sp.AAC.1
MEKERDDEDEEENEEEDSEGKRKRRRRTTRTRTGTETTPGWSRHRVATATESLSSHAPMRPVARRRSSRAGAEEREEGVQST